MKVLLDEMLPIGVRELLPSHEVFTAAYAGLAGLPNGELLRRAVDDGFDAIVTLDRGIPQQQDLGRYPIGFVLITVTTRIGSGCTPTGSSPRSTRWRPGRS